MLHLSAMDTDDLAALSAQMQDAVIRLGDIAFEKKRRVVALVANRFAWDALPDKIRRRAGLRINSVLAARRKHPKPVTPDTILSLLALQFVPRDELSGTLTLLFSGGHAIALDVETIDLQLDDLGPVWGTRREPAHGT